MKKALCTLVVNSKIATSINWYHFCQGNFLPVLIFSVVIFFFGGGRGFLPIITVDQCSFSNTMVCVFALSMIRHDHFPCSLSNCTVCHCSVPTGQCHLQT